MILLSNNILLIILSSTLSGLYIFKHHKYVYTPSSYIGLLLPSLISPIKPISRRVRSGQFRRGVRSRSPLWWVVGGMLISDFLIMLPPPLDSCNVRFIHTYRQTYYAAVRWSGQESFGEPTATALPETGHRRQSRLMSWGVDVDVGTL